MVDANHSDRNDDIAPHLGGNQQRHQPGVRCGHPLVLAGPASAWTQTRRCPDTGAMDVVEFRVGTEMLGAGELISVTPYVNGTSLIELARRVEREPAAADGQPDLAGAYAGLVVYGPASRSWAGLFLDTGGADTWFGDGDSSLLGCTCGDTGCWPLTALVVIDDDTVTWSHFRTGHRDWDLGDLGPFRFQRAAYESALRSP